MKKRMVVSASLCVASVVASCGGGSQVSTTNAFSDQLATVCRTIGRGINNLDAATSLDQIHGNATNASALYEDGINELKKLKVPTSDKGVEADVKDLIASFEDQLDSLDAIAKAAKESDQAAVDDRIGQLTDQAVGSNELADNLNVSRCRLDPVFEAAPATTVPTPLTLPIATLPPRTIPVDTLPIDTIPFDNKVVVSSSSLVPLGDYTFADAPDDAIKGFQALLDLSPLMAAQSGQISGIDVIGSDGQSMGRVFAFEADTDPLTPGSVEEDTPFLTSDTPTTPLTIGTQHGVTWSDPDGTAYFLLGVSNVLLWALAPSTDLLQPTLQAWGESVSQ
ncbi:MAG: hypothetical protein QOE09_1604 [Ilumatobacteraceae bacterium]|jgi:hypothetical protein